MKKPVRIKSVMTIILLIAIVQASNYSLMWRSGETAVRLIAYSRSVRLGQWWISGEQIVRNGDVVLRSFPM
jgi:hypothetical protein